MSPDCSNDQLVIDDGISRQTLCGNLKPKQIEDRYRALYRDLFKHIELTILNRAEDKIQPSSVQTMAFNAAYSLMYSAS